VSTFDTLFPVPNGGRNADDMGMPPELPARCPYCRQPDFGWLPSDLRRGRREQTGTVEYHCYAGYCMD